ncbi:MAG: hypothetical protein K5776_07230 [Lachnospiraceae bacterium]|nr:hypothetical protein [Lachnospiraceae bacterium]
MIFKCKNCGSALEYSADLNKMVCYSCESVFDINEVSAQNDEEDTAKGAAAQSFEFNKPTDYSSADGNQTIIHDNRFEFTNPAGFASKNFGDYNDILEKKKAEEQRREERKHASIQMHIMKCTSCGAELAVNGVETSTFCSYCGQPTVVADRVEDYLEPDYIIPFKVNRDDAERIIRSRLKEGYFIPKQFKNFQVDKMRGIYVPFWLFDMYYHDKQFYKYTRKSGKTSVTRYEYFEGETNFRKLTLDASKNFNDDSSARLEPYDMRQLTDFDSSYLSGFYSDRFDQGYEDVTGAAVIKSKELYNTQVRAELKHKGGKLVSSDPDYRVQNTEYALLPAWFLTFRQDDLPYTILVNGQTGKMVGAVPFDKPKAVGMFISLAFVLSLMCMLICTALSHFFFLQWGFDDKLTWVFFLGCPAIAFMVAAYAKRKFDALKKSLSLTTASQINRFAKERTDR